MFFAIPNSSERVSEPRSRCPHHPDGARHGGAPGAARSLKNPEDLVLFENQVLLTVDLDVRPRPLADQHLVTGLEGEGDPPAVFQDPPRSHPHHLGLLGLLLGGVGDDDPAQLLFRFLQPAHQDPVPQGSHVWHRPASRVMSTSGGRPGGGGGPPLRPRPGPALLRFRPLHLATLMEICLGFASSFLGRVILSRPSLYSALIFSVSTTLGRVKDRVKVP